MKKILLLVLVVVGAVWWLRQPPVQLTTREPAPGSLRDTALGPVSGLSDERQTHAWLGIPFAAPPTGDLRWAAPRPPQPWREPLQASAFAQPCPQLWGPLSGVDGEAGQVVGSEDCLYLNVWAPRDIQGPLPVMLWIHGGGNTIGTANTYPAARLAGEQQVVVVTTNYRLGVLGWMSHPALRAGRDALDGSGNYGLLDLVAALEWVRDNIAAFGGDPDRVTIFGESAGGRNVFGLMAAPQARGLFHRAIAQSGLAVTTPRWRAEQPADADPPGHAASSAEWLLRQLQRVGRAADREQALALLASMAPEELLAFMRGIEAPDLFAGLEGGAGMYSWPANVRDGTVLPAQTLLQLLRDPARYNSVPLITGTNRDELKLFMAQNPQFVERRFGFLPRLKDPAAYHRAAAYGTGAWKAGAVDEVAIAISEHGDQPVFTYRWDWDEGASNWLVDFSELLGAAHGLEVAFIFDDYRNGITVDGLYNAANIPGRDRLAAAMRSYWAEFARSGGPGRGGGGELEQWRPWQGDAPHLMLLDTEAGGGLRLVQEPLTMDSLRQRVLADPALAKRELRCRTYAELFWGIDAGDDYWDPAEYAALGCADTPPWQWQ